MASSKRWTSKHDEQLKQLHHDGATCSGAARELGFHHATVSRHAARLGLTWEQEATRAATKAAIVQSRARRAALSAKLLDRADHLLDQVVSPHEYIAHGGKDFVRQKWTQDEPSPADKRNLMQAASTALGRHLDLEKHDAEQRTETGRSLLGELMERLGVKTPDA